MARYRKIDPRIWNDEKFRALSDSGKLAFLFILTHPSMTSIGAMRGTTAGLAAELEWGVEAFAKAFGEACAKDMIEADAKASFIGVPNFVKYNPPESPNVIKAWADALDLVPECDLRNRHILRLEQVVKGLTEGFREAFTKAFAKTLAKTMPNQEQEQEQEQEQDLYSSAAQKTADAKNTGKASPKPLTNGTLHKWFIGEFCDRWQKRHGAKFPFEVKAKQNGEHVKTIIQAVDANQVALVGVLDRYFADEWVAKNPTHTLEHLRSNLAKYLANRRQTAAVGGSTARRDGEGCNV
jgi:hypothetical protein